MARHFDIPVFYKSKIISGIKKARQEQDPKKKDLSPSILDFGSVRFILARHFGFCFGVENAIEIAYKTLESHPDNRIFFLSEMIHNPNVNNDLQSRGVRFIFTTDGTQIIPWNALRSDDIVVVPAFGTTVEIQEELSARDIDPYNYNTTCPFVEKVWKRSKQLGDEGFTIVLHGKAKHEETRATFSHSIQQAPTVVVFDKHEAMKLADIIREKYDHRAFFEVFGRTCSEGFDPDSHLQRLGVVNQTTMLASETREITRIIKQALIDKYGSDQINHHFADTSDTLCYATNENQNATYALIEQGADISIVVGGYNSSNTSHLVELCQRSMPTYFIKNAQEIDSKEKIKHYDLRERNMMVSDAWLPDKRPLDIILTCGASCPDAMVDEVLLRILRFFPDASGVEEVMRTEAISASN